MSAFDDGTHDVTLEPDDAPTPPFGFPRPKRSYRKAWLSLLAATLAIVVVVAGYTAVRFFIDNNTFNDAHAAYERADCTAAIAPFDDVINAWRILPLGSPVARAQSEKAECLAFQEAASHQQAGNAPGALAAYATFIPGRPPSPLVDAARSRTGDLLKQPDIVRLATIETCDTLPVLRDQNLLDPSTAPTFLAACGSAYAHGNDRQKSQTTYSRLFQEFSTDKVATETEAQLLQDASWCPWLSNLRNDPVLSALKDLIPGLLLTCAKAPKVLPRDAILYMEDFLSKFPSHRFTPDALATLAAMLNKSARSDLSARDFGKEELIGPTPGTQAIIILYNDSPESLRIALSGPEPRVETIAPCPSCPISPPNTPSKNCAKSAIPLRILITPGEYDVAINFNESTTNGAYAHWSLKPAKQYFACYSLSEPNR